MTTDVIFKIQIEYNRQDLIRFNIFKSSPVQFILPICKESKQAHCAWALMAREACSPAPVQMAITLGQSMTYEI